MLDSCSPASLSAKRTVLGQLDNPTGKGNPNDMFSFLHYHSGRPMPLAWIFASTWTPKHDEGTAWEMSTVGSLSSQKRPPKLFTMIGMDKSKTCTFTLGQVFSRGQAFSVSESARYWEAVPVSSLKLPGQLSGFS